MFSYYLSAQSYCDIGIRKLQENLFRLNGVISLNDEKDHFYYSYQLCETKIDRECDFLTCIYTELPDKQFMRSVLPSMLQKMKISQEQIVDKKGLDKTFPKTMNAFWGEYFHIKDYFCLSSQEDYREFRISSLLKNINIQNFWEWKDVLFARIKFCDSVKDQIQSFNVSYWGQMLDRLRELDDFNKDWNDGPCTARIITERTNLTVSNESDTVKNDDFLRNTRIYKLPENNGGKEYFEMHIKAGDFRIHIYPKQTNHTIYIGYIGSHLPLKKK